MVKLVATFWKSSSHTLFCLILDPLVSLYLFSLSIMSPVLDISW